MVESQNGFVDTRLTIGDGYELARMVQFLTSTDSIDLPQQQHHPHDVYRPPYRAPESDADVARQEHRPHGDDPLFPIAAEHWRDLVDDDYDDDGDGLRC